MTWPQNFGMMARATVLLKDARKVITVVKNEFCDLFILNR